MNDYFDRWMVLLVAVLVLVAVLYVVGRDRDCTSKGGSMDWTVGRYGICLTPDGRVIR
jgi:hypothetical protein